MIYANPVTKDGEPIGIKTVSSQVYNTDGTTVEDSLRNLSSCNVNIINVTIKPSNWEGGITKYMQAIVSDINIKSGSVVHICTTDIDTIITLEDIGFQFNIYTTNDGFLTLYANSSASQNINLRMLVVTPKS